MSSALSNSVAGQTDSGNGNGSDADQVHQLHAAALPRLSNKILIGPREYIGGKVMCFAKHTSTGMYFRMGEREVFILQRLDGSLDSAQICAQYQQAFGRKLNLPSLNNALDLFARRGLIEGHDDHSPANLVEAGPISPSPAILEQKLVFWNPDDYMTRIAPYWRWLFNGKSIMIWALLILLTEILLAPQLPAIWDAAFKQPTPIWLRLISLGCVISVITMLHEGGHAITCKLYGGEIREMGFMLRYLIFCAYTKIDDILLFNNRMHRIAVLAVGPLISLTLIPLAYLCWLYLPHDWPLMSLVIDILLWYHLSSLLQLIPFLQSDGYFMLAQALKMPDLRKDAAAYLANAVMARLFGRKPMEVAPECAGYVIPVYLIFGSLSVIITSSVLFFIVRHYVNNMYDWFGEIAGTAIGALLIASVLWKLYSKTWPWLREQYQKLPPKAVS